MAVYINPYTDFGFKKFFGEEANKLDYENSRLQYIGAKEIVNTAKEDGIAEGIAIGKTEGLQLTAKIIKLYTKGFDATAIAEKLQTETATVDAAIAEYEAE